MAAASSLEWTPSLTSTFCTRVRDGVDRQAADLSEMAVGIATAEQGEDLPLPLGQAA
jgi:hypothetical protein